MIFQEGSRLQKICKMCFSNSGLEKFVAPLGLKEIRYGAFCGCESLKRVVLNEGLETLSDHYSVEVFEDSKIEEITLPSTLRKIGSNAFKQCENLRTIYVKSGCRANLSKLDIPSSVRIVRE